MSDLVPYRPDADAFPSRDMLPMSSLSPKQIRDLGSHFASAALIASHSRIADEWIKSRGEQKELAIDTVVTTSGVFFDRSTTASTRIWTR